MPSATMTWTVKSDRLGQIKATMERKAALIVAKTALDWEANAKSIARAKGVYHYGLLIASIQATKITETHWTIVVGVEYGAYNEYGTVRMAARPFFGPAGQVVRPQFLQALRTVMR